MLLMSRPGRKFSGKELADAGYEGREDGGPETAINIITVTFLNLRRRFARHGILLHLNGCRGRNGGTAFAGFGLCEFTPKVRAEKKPRKTVPKKHKDQFIPAAPLPEKPRYQAFDEVPYSFPAWREAW